MLTQNNKENMIVVIVKSIIKKTIDNTFAIKDKDTKGILMGKHKNEEIVEIFKTIYKRKYFRPSF